MTTILANLSGKIVGLGDHPDAGLRPIGTGDHATNVVIIDGQTASCWLAGSPETPHAAISATNRRINIKPNDFRVFHGRLLNRSIRQSFCIRQTIGSNIQDVRSAPTYFANGSGRNWNFTTFGRVPLPPSMWNGVRVPVVAHRPLPFQPPFGSSILPSIHLA